MSLNDIVTVNISTETTAPSRVGFGTPLIMGYHTLWPERARTYASYQAVLDDGFPSTSAIARCAQSIFSQNPKVTSVVVGRAANAPTQVITVDVIDAVDDTDYAITINGTEFEIDSGAGATPNSIAVALAAAINAGAEPVTAGTPTLGEFTLTADVAGDLFTCEVDRAQITKQTTTADPGIVADITAVRQANDDWYCLALTSLGKAEIKAAAAYIEAAIKIMAVSSSDDDIPTTAVDDLASEMAALNYARTVLLYHPDAETYYPAAGWAGIMLPGDPGSATWKFKTIAGSPVTVITETEKTNLENKSCNHYREIAGVAITQQGVTCSGEFADVTRFVDFIRARLQEYIYGVLVNRPKVPFTDPGIGLIENQVRAVMSLGINSGGFAADPAPTVTVPKAADVPFTDKASRTLPDVEFAATLAGAIHQLTVNGSVTV